MTPRRVAIVPHTHWDREWYEPYQTFRMNLVDTLDQLLAIMEADPSYSHFLLDGQLAALDDYLEVRPDAAPALRHLAATGRLSVGPWYILLDEFLVSPETIIRNLDLGIARAAEFGGTIDVGYLPDMFGHIAQMPQILRLAGFEHAVVWRGVPSAITQTGFWWESPDGSRVRAEYLPVGYSNGAVLPPDAKGLIERVADHQSEVAEFLIDDILLMNGSDHLPPQPHLGSIVAEANVISDDFTFEIVALDEFLARAPVEGLSTWRGELRSGARSNLLMGVTSNRVDVKRAAAAAERQLEVRAEPYDALFGLPSNTAPTERFFEIAWREVIRNAAHDSICACSVDDVVDAVLHRFAEASRIGEGIAKRALADLARSMADPGPVIVNPAASARSGIVELVVSADDEPGPDVQVVSERFGLPGSMTLDADTVRTVLGMLQGPKIDNDAWIHEIRIEEDDTGISLTIAIGPDEKPNVPIAEAKQEMYSRLGARPDVSVRVSLDQPKIRRIVARCHDVPGFGWRAFAPAPLAHPVSLTDDDPAVGISNGLVRVAVDPATGTFSVNDLPGFGRLVDGGDLGDSYNYSPPGADTLLDTPETVSVEVLERGPVRARVKITTTYLWPERVAGGSQQRTGEVPVSVESTLELRADDPLVHLDVTFVNPARDHRVRLHFPLPEPADHSEAGCAFTTVTRGLTAEGRSDEFGLPTFPAHRFLRAGRLTALFEGVLEYELLRPPDAAASAAAAEVAFTLVRSTGMLSRLGMTYRPFPAGPLTPVDGLQMVGSRIATSIALHVAPASDDTSGSSAPVPAPWTHADEIVAPLEVVSSLGGGDRPHVGSALSVNGARVSACRRRGRLLEIRLFNPTDAPTIARIPDRSGWVVDLRGRLLSTFDGSISLRPHEIITIHLEET